MRQILDAADEDQALAQDGVGSHHQCVALSNQGRAVLVLVDPGSEPRLVELGADVNERSHRVEIGVAGDASLSQNGELMDRGREVRGHRQVGLPNDVQPLARVEVFAGALQGQGQLRDTLWGGSGDASNDVGKHGLRPAPRTLNQALKQLNLLDGFLVH